MWAMPYISAVPSAGVLTFCKPSIFCHFHLVVNKNPIPFRSIEIQPAKPIPNPFATIPTQPDREPSGTGIPVPGSTHPEECSRSEFRTRFVSFDPVPCSIDPVSFPSQLRRVAGWRDGSNRVRFGIGFPNGFSLFHTLVSNRAISNWYILPIAKQTKCSRINVS